jgi:hypothetical protein
LLSAGGDAEGSTSAPALAECIEHAFDAGYWAWHRTPDKPVIDGSIFSVAVLPFTNLGNDRNDDASQKTSRRICHT